MATRRWLKIGGGVAAGVTTILGLFSLLSVLYGFEIIDLTGDIVCEGTYDNPCISEFEVRNPNAYNVDIYSKDQVKLDFSPEIEDWALFIPDGRCSATGKCACDLKNGEKIGFDGWRCIDFTNKTKPRVDKEYNFRFERYSTTKFKLVGIKKRITDTVKWTFGTNSKELDPTWYGTRDVLLVWGHSTNNFPEYSEGTLANSWTAKAAVHTDVVVDTVNTILTQNPRKSEQLITWIDTDEDIHVKLWNGSSWSGYQEIDTDGHISDRFQGVDAGVESQSGDYFVAWARAATADDDFVWFSTYDQDTQTWSNPDKFAEDIGNGVENVIVVSHPFTDEILVIATDSLDTGHAWIWNGNQPTNYIQFSTDLEDGSTGDPTTNTPEVPVSGAWHNSTDEAVIIWGDETDVIRSRRWNGASWDNAKTQKSGALGTDVQFIILRSSIFENKIRGGIFDNDNDIWIFELNSTMDITNLTEIDTTGYTDQPYRSIDVVMPAQGRFIFSWNDPANGPYLNDSYNSASIQTFTANNPLHVVGNFMKDRAMFAVGDDTGDLSVFMFNITSGSTSYADDIETAMEEEWNMQIQPNQFFGAPLPSFNPDVTECRELSVPNKVYTLQNNIEDQIGDCIVITANNVTFNGQGKIINFSLGPDEPFDIIGGIRIKNHNTIIKNVTVTTYDTYLSGNAVGIWVDSYGAGFAVENATIQDARVDGGDNFAVLFDIEGKNHKIINSYATNPDQYVLIEYQSSNVLWENITYDVGTGSSFGAVSFYESNDSIIKNMQSNDNLAILHVAEGDNVKNATIINSNFNSGSVSLESGTDYIFINTTYGEENVNGGNLTRKWYLEFQINDSETHQGISSASWNLRDKDNQVASGTTDASGFQNKIIATQYINQSGVTNDRNPHNLTTTKSGYYDNSTIFSLTGNMFLQLFMTQSTTCNYGGGDWNIDCSDNCTISNNVTINSGYNISMTGVGIFTIQNGARISGWDYRYAQRSCYVKAFGSGGFFQ